MNRNVGSTDQVLRIVVGALAGIVSISIVADMVSLPAVLSPVLGIVAIMMLGTSVTGTCPIYSILGVETCSRSSRPS
jgi:ammonia channel protein AmtB